VRRLQTHKLIQICTNTDYCLVAFCTWILTTRCKRHNFKRASGHVALDAVEIVKGAAAAATARAAAGGEGAEKEEEHEQGE
jgi:hypothetical protein